MINMRTNTNGKSLSSVFILWLDAFIINHRNKDNKIKITKIIFATILNTFILNVVLFRFSVAPN
jgi:hypothetical protein